MIIFRYLNKELASALASITVILLGIFISNQLVRYLSYAADGRLEVMAIARLLVIEIPHLLGLLLPLGIYLAILLVFGRFCLDQEMVILRSAGLGYSKIMKMLAPLTMGVAGVVAILVLGVNPSIMNYRNTILEETGSAVALKTMLPGRFQELSGGKQVLYAGHISANRQQIYDIFVAERNEDESNSHWDILVASEGYQWFDKKNKEQFVISTNSKRYIGIPGQKDFQIIQYGRYGLKVQKHRSATLSEEDSIPTRVLNQTAKKYLSRMAELQWRISLPIMVIVLVLIALPLSQIKRGQGKYARFFPAILIYVIYANLLIVTRSWVARGLLSPYLGMFWVPLTILLGLCFYYSYPVGKYFLLKWRQS